MTIQQANEVDGMGIDRSRNELVLLISDHLSWENEEAHISSLEEKIDGYLNFIESGQYLKSVPEAKGLPIRIKLVHEHKPTKSALPILKAVSEKLENMNIEFSYEDLPVNY